MQPSKNRPNGFNVRWDHKKRQLHLSAYGTIAVLVAGIGAVVVLAIVVLK
jgi:hypothetical protein